MHRCLTHLALLNRCETIKATHTHQSDMNMQNKLKRTCVQVKWDPLLILVDVPDDDDDADDDAWIYVTAVRQHKAQRRGTDGDANCARCTRVARKIPTESGKPFAVTLSLCRRVSVSVHAYAIVAHSWRSDCGAAEHCRLQSVRFSFTKSDG